MPVIVHRLLLSVLIFALAVSVAAADELSSAAMVVTSPSDCTSERVENDGTIDPVFFEDLDRKWFKKQYFLQAPIRILGNHDSSTVGKEFGTSVDGLWAGLGSATIDFSTGGHLKFQVSLKNEASRAVLFNVDTMQPPLTYLMITPDGRTFFIGWPSPPSALKEMYHVLKGRHETEFTVTLRLANQMFDVDSVGPGEFPRLRNHQFSAGDYIVYGIAHVPYFTKDDRTTVLQAAAEVRTGNQLLHLSAADAARLNEAIAKYTPPPPTLTALLPLPKPRRREPVPPPQTPGLMARVQSERGMHAQGPQSSSAIDALPPLATAVQSGSVDRREVPSRLWMVAGIGLLSVAVSILLRATFRRYTGSDSSG